MPRARTLALHAAMIALSVAMGFPLLWMAVSGMKSGTAILAAPLAMPETWSLEPYLRAWREGHFGRHFGNSIVVTGCAVALVLALASMAGFALARFTLPGSAIVRGLLIVGLLLPIEGILLPLHGLVEALRINQSRLALILPYAAIELPIATFLFAAFFKQIPREIEEAARMDGCNAWQLYWRIFLPMGTQVVGVISILTFLAFWNEFLLANTLVHEESIQTMPAAFNSFYGRHRIDYQLVFAGLTVYVLPAVAFYLVMSRAITRSVTAGAMKG